MTLEVGIARVAAAQPCCGIRLIPLAVKERLQIQHVLFDRVTHSPLQDAPSKNSSALKTAVGIQKSCGYLTAWFASSSKALYGK